MLGTSACPHCNATFNVGEAQINAHLGLVRCEACLELFDFRISYVPVHHESQLELLISDEHKTSSALSADDRISEALAAARQREIFGDDDLTESHDEGLEHALTDDVHETESEHLQPSLPMEDNSTSETLLNEINLPTHDELNDPQEVEYAFAKKSYRVWPWAVGSCLALLIAALQAGYFFRAEIAAKIPVTKSTLVSACQLLNCTIPLPQNASLMNIESSDLTDAQSQVIFNALLRNHAAYVQAFPNLELTFTDTQDNLQARRIFRPIDYLLPTENEVLGLLPNREINIKLHFDTADIKPSGYRLMLFYTQ